MHARNKSSNGDVVARSPPASPFVSHLASRENVASSARNRSLRLPPSVPTPNPSTSISLANSMKCLTNIVVNTVTFIALTGVVRAFPLATRSCLAACLASLYNPPRRPSFAYIASANGRVNASNATPLVPVNGSLTAFPISYQNTSSRSGVSRRLAHSVFKHLRSSP